MGWWVLFRGVNVAELLDVDEYITHLAPATLQMDKGDGDNHEW